jgi:protein-disulfide isomerase
MNRISFLAVVLISVVALTAVSGQSPRRRTPARSVASKPRPSTTPTPAPAAQPTPTAPAELAPATLAVVNDITITAADIEAQVSATILGDPDPYLRAFYQEREKETKEARQRALDARIGSLLVAAEAKKRGQTTEEFLNREVNNKIPTPSETEIQAAYDSSRAQIGNADLEKVRPDIINLLREQKRQELYLALMNRLKMTNSVVKHADVNAPSLASGTVLAAVNSEPIRIEAINERMKAYVYKLEMRIYAAQKQATDRRINDLLLIADANKRNIGPEEIVRTEVTDKLKPPTEAEIAKFYDENRERIKIDLAAARNDIANYLQQEQQEKLETALSEKLRAGANVRMFLKEPEPPVINVSAANGPSRGDPQAAVTIIEFTDFQCSACGAMYPVMEDILKSYGNRVRFVVRNFPLTLLHANAFRAAQAASAANAQGKFWEYIDLLFKNQSALDVDSLKKYATQVGLDRKRFDGEFDSGKYDAEIRRDMEAGDMYGIEGTPTIFINGVILTPPEYSADGLRAAIERAFARTHKRAS